MIEKKDHPKLDNLIGMDTKDHIYLSYTYLITLIFQLLTNVGEPKLNHNPSFENTLMMQKEGHLK